MNSSVAGNRRPKVSIISIALDAAEFDGLQEFLSRQTYRDFEFVGEQGGTIPEAWNRGVKRALGEILIFTETDARPLRENWIEELVEQVEKTSAIVKGLEITSSPLDMSNLAGYRNIFLDHPFDEGFRWAEDTEIICRLKDSGLEIIQADCAPVIHLDKAASRRHIRRAFRYGLYWARLRHRYPDTQDVAGGKEILKLLVKSVLNLFGYLAGFIIYFPERIKRK